MSNQHSKLTGLLFDLDGVLINSLPVMKLALNAALKEVYRKRTFDIETVFAEYRQYLGMGFPDIVKKMGLSEQLYQPFRRHSRYLAPYVDLYPNIIDLLETAKSLSLTMAIATGKDYQRTEELLTQLKINQYFSSIYSSDTVTAPKPAPEMVNCFCADYSLQADQVLFLGDAEADIHCGQAAHCITAYADWGYGNKREIALLAPDYNFDSPMDARIQILALANQGGIKYDAV